MSDFPPSGYALLRVFLPAESLDPVVYSWLAFDAAGQLQGQGESAPAELPQAIKLELVIPAQKLAAHRLTLPQQSLKYQDALIAQGLEDRLLGNRQDIVAVPGPLSGSQGDALDAVLGLAAKIDAPLKPKLIEANNTQIRITLSDTQAAQFKDKLERGGSPEKSPAEQGWTRLQYKLEKR